MADPPTPLGNAIGVDAGCNAAILVENVEGYVRDVVQVTFDVAEVGMAALVDKIVTAAAREVVDALTDKVDAGDQIDDATTTDEAEVDSMMGAT
jgi:hypothetical protein